MQTQVSNSSARRRSPGRQALDVVLFLAAAGVVGWSGFHRIGEGVVSLRRGPEVALATQPGLFWGLTALHLAVVVICLVIGGLSARALLRSIREARS